MLRAGVHPRTVEEADRQAGMPMPPLALQGEESLLLAAHVADLAAEGRPRVERPGKAAARALFERGLVGRKASRSFYDNAHDDAGGDKRLWPGLAELYSTTLRQPPMRELVDPLLFAQAVESFRCIEGGALRSTTDGNDGSILGWDSAPCYSGTLRFIVAMGATGFAECTADLAANHARASSRRPSCRPTNARAHVMAEGAKGKRAIPRTGAGLRKR